MPYEPIVRSEMPELDALRGLAIAMVVFYHGFFWMNGPAVFTGLARLFVTATMLGWLGVNLFFVLSGFLITGILLDTRTKPNYFKSFYTKRALRILPAYYGTLAALAIAGMASHASLLWAFFFLANVSPLFGVPSPLSVLWSLAVEEHFYLLWPTLVRGFSVRALEYLALGIAGAVPLVRALSFVTKSTAGVHGATWCEADGLVMGAWLAIQVRKPGFRRENLAWVSGCSVAIAVFAILAGARFGILTKLRLLGAAFQETSANLIFLGVLGLFLLLGTSRWKSLVQWPVLKFYGRISYGLYLIHLLIFGAYNKSIDRLWPGLPSPDGHFGVVMFRFLVCLSISTGLAFLSRQYFEEPFLQMRKRFPGVEIQKMQSSASN